MTEFQNLAMFVLETASSMSQSYTPKNVGWVSLRLTQQKLTTVEFCTSTQPTSK